MRNYAVMPLLKGTGLKNRNFRGFSPGKEVPKPFLTAAAKSAA
jgi:hypothetical protein